MKKIIISLFILVLGVSVIAQENMNTGIIYGSNNAYSLTAPEGWILDNESGVSQGLYAVFYKKGETWNNAETVMYTNTATLENKPTKTIPELINYDIETFRNNYKGITITDGKNIQIKEGLLAEVKLFSGGSYANYEATAYIDAGKVGVMIVLSSRTKQGFEESFSSFEMLVKSYYYITDKVILDNK